MERQNSCRSPRGRLHTIVLLVLVSLFGATAILVCIGQGAYAASAPSVVIEDTITLGVNGKTVEFDTTHFGEPSLLVSTVKNGDGNAFIVRVRTDTPEIAETLCTFQSVPLLVRAGLLDADGFPDLLVSLDKFCPDDSLSYSSVLLHGPDFELADTICSRSSLSDAIIDDSSHEIWLTYSPGRVLHRGNLHDNTTEDTVISSVGTVELERRDVNGGGSPELVAIWQRNFRGGVVPPGEPPWPSEASCGIVVASDSGGIVLSDVWLYKLGSAYIDLRVEIMTPVAFGHLGGGEAPAAVISYWYSPTGTGPTNWGLNAVALRSLVTGDSLWIRSLPSSPKYMPAGASLWHFDDDDSLDVLVSEKVATEIIYNPPTVNAVWGLKGSTGDSLFYFESPYVLDPVVVGSLDNSGIRKGVLVRADTLFIFHLDFTTTGIDDEVGITPATFTLHQNYPNPFNAQTHIEYEINRPVHAALNVYDILGRHVTTLIDALQSAGKYDVTWNGRNAKDAPVPSGVYFYRMKSGDTEQVRKMLLLK